MTTPTGPYAPFDSRAYAVSRAAALPVDDARVQAASRSTDWITPSVFIVCTSHRQRAKIMHAVRSVTGSEPRSYYTMRRGGVLLAVHPVMAEALRHGPGVTRWRRLPGEGEPRLCLHV